MTKFSVITIYLLLLIHVIVHFISKNEIEKINNWIEFIALLMFVLTIIKIKEND